MSGKSPEARLREAVNKVIREADDLSVESLEALRDNLSHRFPARTPDGERRYLTREEAAERAGKSIATIDRWLEKGLLTKLRPKGLQHVRIDEKELIDLLTFTPSSAGLRESQERRTADGTDPLALR